MIQEKVFLKKKDFDAIFNDEFYNGKFFHDDYITNYTSHDNCPLARACKRHFKTDKVSVNPMDFGVEINGEFWSNTNEWSVRIAYSVARCLHVDKDKTKYYVTLTKS